MQARRPVTVLSWEHCHQDIASHQTLKCIFTVLVRHVCGEQGRIWVSHPPLCPPHLLPTCWVFFFICHWQCERKGARFLRVSHQKLQVQIPNGPLSEQEHSQLAFVTMKQASFKFTEGHFYTKKKSSVWLNLQPFRLNHLLVVLWIINIMKPLIIYGRLLLFNVSITLLGSFSFLLPLKNGSIYKLLPIIAHISVSRLVMCTKSNALRILAAWCCYGIQPYYIMLMLRTPQFLLFFLGGGGVEVNLQQQQMDVQIVVQLWLGLR